MDGRPGLTGNAVKAAAGATVAANGGLSTWGFKTSLTVVSLTIVVNTST